MKLLKNEIWTKHCLWQRYSTDFCVKKKDRSFTYVEVFRQTIALEIYLTTLQP